MKNKLERMCKEAVVAYCKALPLNMDGGTDEYHEIPQSG
jgi:hypothetical protein